MNFFLNKTFNSFPRVNKYRQAPRKSIESECMFSKGVKFFLFLIILIE